MSFAIAGCRSQEMDTRETFVQIIPRGKKEKGKKKKKKKGKKNRTANEPPVEGKEEEKGESQITSHK